MKKRLKKLNIFAVTLIVLMGVIVGYSQSIIGQASALSDLAQEVAQETTTSNNTAGKQRITIGTKGESGAYFHAINELNNSDGYVCSFNTTLTCTSFFNQYICGTKIVNNIDDISYAEYNANKTGRFGGTCAEKFKCVNNEIYVKRTKSVSYPPNMKATYAQDTEIKKYSNSDFIAKYALYPHTPLTDILTPETITKSDIKETSNNYIITFKLTSAKFKNVITFFVENIMNEHNIAPQVNNVTAIITINKYGEIVSTEVLVDAICNIKKAAGLDIDLNAKIAYKETYSSIDNAHTYLTKQQLNKLFDA